MPALDAPRSLEVFTHTSEAVAGGLPAISVVVPDSPAASLSNPLRPVERMEVGPGLLARTVESTH